MKTIEVIAYQHEDAHMRPEDIQRAHDELGYKLGWRFMTCPERNKASARMLLVSLNPSGTHPHGPEWSQEAGSAYLIESWDGQPAGMDPLQQQVQRLLPFLGYAPDELFSAHLVPFRSPRWKDLKNKRAALAFARQLWAWLLPQLHPKVVVCIGHPPGRQLASLLGLPPLRRLPTGWGNYALLRGDLPGGAPLVAFPHLGTFRLFGAPRYAPFITAAFK